MLKRGNKGEAVIMLQVALREVAMYKGIIDGDFGPATEAAVKQFQQAAGMYADGIVGDRTWKALNDKTSILSNKVLYLMIHCTASRANTIVTKALLEQMHMGPADSLNGAVRYKGRTFASRDLLPPDRINGQLVKFIQGRGWTKCGYRHLVQQNGDVIAVTPSDDDTLIESFEVTFGALGFNNNCIHIVYAGGVEDDGLTPKDTRTEAQKARLANLVKSYINLYPTIKILGHNQVASKGCPSFDVPTWLREIGVDEKNIF